MSSDNNAVVKVATRKVAGENTEAMENQYGDKFRLRPVSRLAIAEAMGEIHDPIPPSYINPNTGASEPNPASEEYQKALQQVKAERAQVAADALIYFGIEMITPVPEDEKWLQELTWFLKRKKINLDFGELEDPTNKEFLYKKYRIASDPAVLEKLNEVNGFSEVKEEQVAAARATFPDSSGGDSDNREGTEQLSQP